jgi:hypothetical protein
MPDPDWFCGIVKAVKVPSASAIMSLFFIAFRLDRLAKLPNRAAGSSTNLPGMLATLGKFAVFTAAMMMLLKV